MSTCLNYLRNIIDPYSAVNLMKRASKLEDCAYKIILQFTAVQVERGVVSTKEAKTAIFLIRRGYNYQGILKLKPTHDEIEELQRKIDAL